MPSIVTPVFLPKLKAKVVLTFSSASRKMLFAINERCQYNAGEHFNRNVPQLGEKKSLEAWCSGVPASANTA